MSDRASLTPISTLRVSQHTIPKHGFIPNTSVQHIPLTIYHGAFTSPDLTASQVESHIQSVGVCTPQRRYTMYSQTHFHSTTHELLVVSSGNAKLLFVEERVKKGDVILIPAGVGHRLPERSDRFEMVDSYPAGADKWDICYGREGVEN
ncbi:hypothetical protein PHLGIDRAFT_25184 [Phlebiopsis gigantea 11061_1 CR5-6]|uniref:Cupin type-2 domain-containing protein n=1 Tax=Phlebiopsis gigantea (strain 11061_1 CR5-6) TaxID=745531 RepID=A0A0C3PH90_PHLG1|nr:hypothetical protein PHLGIDRAFT_25184 [Phlebiopsis gigantea 11061_1 CR5-6]